MGKSVGNSDSMGESSIVDKSKIQRDLVLKPVLAIYM